MKPEVIRQRRQNLNLSQADLAERLGVTSNTVSRWELGTATPEAAGMLTLAFRALELDAAFNAPDIQAAAKRFRSRPISRGVKDLIAA